MLKILEIQLEHTSASRDICSQITEQCMNNKSTLQYLRIIVPKKKSYYHSDLCQRDLKTYLIGLS